MKVFVVHENIYHAGNPYIYTLVEGVRSLDSTVEFGYGREAFWNDSLFSYDIVHFQWPSGFMYGEKSHNEDDLESRLKELRRSKVLVFSTCHDLEPHYNQCSEFSESMRIVYRNTDVFIHLGAYSKTLFEVKYPTAEHIMIPHHIYDTVYTCFPSKEESFKVLRLNKHKKYILCFGMFRADEEREMVLDVIKELKNKGYLMLAPGFDDLNYDSSIPLFNNRVIFQLLKFYRILRLRVKGIVVTGRAYNSVPDSMLPYYYSVADMCFIHRKKILNSGNLFLPMLFDRVVVGPDTGNVGEWLHKINYPSFDVNDFSNILQSISDGLELSKTDIAKNNHQHFLEMFSTLTISKLLLNAYKKSITSHTL